MDDPRALFSRFVGTWRSDERSGDALDVETEGASTYRLACDGKFLVCDYEQRANGAVTFTGHGVYGWDGRAERYTMHWFDAGGVDPGAPAFGVLEGDTLTFARDGARYVYTFAGAGALSFRIERLQEGREPLCVMRSEYRRA